MKCLSLWQPWATLIVIGAKHYETRSWSTSFRGPLLIHAAKKRDEDSLLLCLEEPFRSALVAGGIEKIGDLPFGCILGQARLFACHQTEGIAPWLEDPERSFGNYSDGRYAFELANHVRFQTPVPLRAFQGIFNVPDELVAEQLAKTGQYLTDH